MNQADQQSGPLADVRQAVADDLLALSRLHGRELDWRSIATRQGTAYDDLLHMQLRGEQGLTALAMMRAGLRVIPTSLLE